MITDVAVITEFFFFHQLGMKINHDQYLRMFLKARMERKSSTEPTLVGNEKEKEALRIRMETGDNSSLMVRAQGWRVIKFFHI